VAKPTIDIFRKAVNDAGINGKNWRKNEAFDDFTRFFNESFTEEQRESMKYDEVLKVGKIWWQEHHSKYS
jgi:hypothetical protein